MPGSYPYRRLPRKITPTPHQPAKPRQDRKLTYKLGKTKGATDSRMSRLPALLTISQRPPGPASPDALRTWNGTEHSRSERARAPVVIVGSYLQHRISEVFTALGETTGEQRKCRVAEYFDAFLRTRTSNEKGWQTATDVDVLEWVCWLDSHGNGIKLVRVVTCPGVGLDDSSLCSNDGRCGKRYAAASLDKRRISKLK